MKFDSLPKNSFITNKIDQKEFWKLMIEAIKDADKVSILYLKDFGFDLDGYIYDILVSSIIYSEIVLIDWF